MDCKFCQKTRYHVNRVVKQVFRSKFEVCYAREISRNFRLDPGYHLFYIKDAKQESVVVFQYPGSANAYVGYASEGADAVADLTTGQVYKDKEHADLNFEDFFYYYIGSFQRLNTLYVKNLQG